MKEKTENRQEIILTKNAVSFSLQKEGKWFTGKIADAWMRPKIFVLAWKVVEIVL